MRVGTQRLTAVSVECCAKYVSRPNYSIIHCL